MFLTWTAWATREECLQKQQKTGRRSVRAVFFSLTKHKKYNANSMCVVALEPQQYRKAFKRVSKEAALAEGRAAMCKKSIIGTHDGMYVVKL